MKKILIIGLGIGSMYRRILNSDYSVFTVDVNPETNPDYQTIEDAISKHNNFDVVLICTPNYLHSVFLKELCEMSKIVLVEKPGLKDLETWNRFFKLKKNLFMVKNNMFRKDIEYISNFIYDNLNIISGIDINWINKDRIPNPGSWFTTKSKSWGGVSRDLMPHLLSIYYKIFEHASIPVNSIFNQCHTLDTITSTEYGKIDKKGVYDVDDLCQIKFYENHKNITLNCNWKSDIKSDIGIRIYFKNKKEEFYELGLCPEDAYLTMIKFFIDKIDNSDFINEQYKIDKWIIKLINY